MTDLNIGCIQQSLP